MEPIWDFRDLTAHERAVMDRLVQNSGELRPKLEADLRTVKVVSRCGCGCPTLDFGLAPRERRTTAGWIGAAGDFQSPDGRHLELTLLLDAADRLASLDVTDQNAREGAYVLPPADQIHYFSRRGRLLDDQAAEELK